MGEKVAWINQYPAKKNPYQPCYLLSFNKAASHFINLLIQQSIPLRSDKGLPWLTRSLIDIIPQVQDHDPLLSCSCHH